MRKFSTKVSDGFVKETAGAWPNVSPVYSNANPAHLAQNSSPLQKTSNSPISNPILTGSPFPFSTEAMDPLSELEQELFSPIPNSFSSPVFDFSPASSIPSLPPSTPSSSNINLHPHSSSMLHSPSKSVYNFQNSSVTGTVPLNEFGINTTMMPNTLNMADNAFVTTTSHVSPAIADRQKKLEKYRQKRAKRKPFDRSETREKRSQAANARPRDEFGHFRSNPDSLSSSGSSTPTNSAPSTPLNNSINDVISLLYESKRESNELKTKLALVFDEMLSLRQKAEEASAAKEEIKKELENQQQINSMLLHQNRLLWSTVPHNEVFSTVQRTNSIPSFNVNAFKEKVDLSKIDLNWTNSPLLEAAKAENENFGKRWEEMSFLMGAIHPNVNSPSHPLQDAN